MFEAAKKDPNWFAAVFKASGDWNSSAGGTRCHQARDRGRSLQPEFECSFDAAVKGTYYSQYMADAAAGGRIRSVPLIPALASSRLGTWVLAMLQRYGSRAVIFREVRLIDYMEIDGKGIPEIVRALKAKPYIYTTHLLLTMLQLVNSAGKSRQEVLRASASSLTSCRSSRWMTASRLCEISCLYAGSTKKTHQD